MVQSAFLIFFFNKNRDFLFSVPQFLGWFLDKKVSEVAQSFLTLRNPVDCSLPGSSIHGILQVRILEWVAISFSGGSSQPRDWTQVSCIAGRCFTLWATREAPDFWTKATQIKYLPFNIKHKSLNDVKTLYNSQQRIFFFFSLLTLPYQMDIFYV